MQGFRGVCTYDVATAQISHCSNSKGEACKPKNSIFVVVFLTGANIFFFTAEILLTYLKLYSYNAVLSYDDSMAENTFMIS